ncbi:MAG: hypothetical protein ACYC6Y_17700 [Thermoguttaceae bacterium]
MIWFLTGPFLYFAAVVLLAGGTWKVIVLGRFPNHLRWELYPIPRLGPEGSSHLEKQPGGSPLAGTAREVSFMLQEILALKKVFAGRRDLWVGSMLLHGGLYLGIVFLAFLAFDAAMVALRGPAASAELPPSGLLGSAISVVAVASALAGLAGAVYLLVLRLADRGLRDMSDRVTFLNLVLLAALFGSGLAYWLQDPACGQARAHAASLLRGRPGAVGSPWLASAMVLTGLLAMYLPFSRMFHFAAKYFFYHSILWDDHPMTQTGPMKQEMARSLGEQVTWSASHVRQRRSWTGQLAADEAEKDAAP